MKDNLRYLSLKTYANFLYQTRLIRAKKIGLFRRTGVLLSGVVGERLCIGLSQTDWRTGETPVLREVTIFCVDLILLAN